MTVAQRLLDVLKNEEKLIRTRNLGALEEVTREKESLMARLDEGASVPLLRQIQTQAKRNTELSTSVINAVRSLQARLRAFGEEFDTVAYAPDGESLSCQENSVHRRV